MPALPGHAVATLTSVPRRSLGASSPFSAELPLAPLSRCACGTSDHFVQFYQHDDFLVSSVGRFVIQGLASGGATLVIATPAHLDGVATHLESAGVELPALIESGRYVPLDAAATLAKFMVNGMPSPEAFMQHVGTLVARLTTGGSRLSAFGEMVALLWADGNTEAAIRLEELWNTLSERHVFALFCAYPMQGFDTSGAGRPFLHVCKAHSRVLPTEEYSAEGLTTDDRLRAIAILEQRAAALESEIAERKRVEELLRRREAELTAFIETAAVGLHWVDADGVILWANAAELELLGYDRAEYVGRNISEFHVERRVIDDILARLRNGERLRNQEARVRCKDGTIKTILIDSNVLWDNGRFVHTQCVTRDVTEQRQMEMFNRHLAAIVEGSDDAILSKTLEGVITSWNTGAQQIFGYTAEETVNRPITLLIPPDRIDEELGILARLRRGERIKHYETIRRRKDGALLDISLTISPIHWRP